MAHSRRCSLIFNRSLGFAWISFIALSLVFAAAAEAAPATEGQGLRLYVIDCGGIRGLDLQEFVPAPESEGQTLDLVNRCYVVRHPKGTLVWDTGFPDLFTSWYMRSVLWLMSWGGPEIRIERSFEDGLAEIDLAPADVDYLVFSHVHLDHAGNGNLFAKSTWIVPEVEWKAVFDEEERVEIPHVEKRFFEKLLDARTVKFSGDYDVFGDGSVVILAAPGHTPGHQCLFLNLPKTGPVVLSGDLYHSHINRELQVAPAFNTDREESVRSMKRIEEFVAQRGAKLWIQHDIESNAGIPLAPEFIE